MSAPDKEFTIIAVRGKKRLIILIIIFVLSIGVLVYLLFSNKSAPSPVQLNIQTPKLNPSLTPTPTIPFKQEYANPFEKKQEYTNPFENKQNSQNPFDNLQ